MSFRFKLKDLKDSKKFLIGLKKRELRKEIYYNLLKLVEDFEKINSELNSIRMKKNNSKEIFELKKLKELEKGLFEKLKRLKKERNREELNLPNPIYENFDELKRKFKGGIIFQKNFEKGKETKTYLELEKEYSYPLKNPFSNFHLMNKVGVLKERELIIKSLEGFEKKGYEEIGEIPLFLPKKYFQFAGQFPNLKDYLFSFDGESFLIPTAETGFMKIFENRIFSEKDLEKNNKFMILSECFRKEKGQTKDLKNKFRMFQFKKLELFRITLPEKDEFETIQEIMEDMKELLEEFKISYRFILNEPEDFSFQASLSVDLEVYLQNTKKWIEISTISSCSDFQSKGMNLKISGREKKFAYTFNASGFGFSRLFLAKIERDGI